MSFSNLFCVFQSRDPAEKLLKTTSNISQQRLKVTGFAFDSLKLTGVILLTKYLFYF